MRNAEKYPTHRKYMGVRKIELRTGESRRPGLALRYLRYLDDVNGGLLNPLQHSGR